MFVANSSPFGDVFHCQSDPWNFTKPHYGTPSNASAVSLEQSKTQAIDTLFDNSKNIRHNS